MEKVIESWEDCVILSTKKNNMIEITASNLPKYKSAVKRYNKEKFSNIYNIKSGKLNIIQKRWKSQYLVTTVS